MRLSFPNSLQVLVGSGQVESTVDTSNDKESIGDSKHKLYYCTSFTHLPSIAYTASFAECEASLFSSIFPVSGSPEACSVSSLIPMKQHREHGGVEVQYSESAHRVRVS